MGININQEDEITLGKTNEWRISTLKIVPELVGH